MQNVIIHSSASMRIAVCRSSVKASIAPRSIIPFFLKSKTCQQQQQMSVRSRAASPTSQPSAPEVFQDGVQDPIMAAFQKFNSAAPRPSPADDARTWVALSKHAVLATIDSKNQFPSTSIVEFAADAHGKPILATSTLSSHTGDMQANPRVSITISAPNFNSMDDGRVTLQGTMRAVSAEEKPALREVYLKKHPHAFYVDFGDFQWFILDDLKAVKYNGGFARARKITPDEYYAAKPDPVTAFSKPVCGHMNDDHGGDLQDMVRHFTPLTDVETVKLIDLDRLGMNAEVTRQGATFKARLPFIRPAEDRKSIKDVIVDMTKAARTAKATGARVPGASD